MIKTIKDFHGTIIITNRMIESGIPPNSQAVVYGLLWTISEGGKYDLDITGVDISRLFGWSKGTACRVINQLIKFGYIERFRDLIIVNRLGDKRDLRALR